jgi:hypothetical protein
MHFCLRFITFLGASLLTWTPTSARSLISEGVGKRELVSYEERYINSRSYKHPNETVKLVGCKKMKIPSSEIEDFEDHYYTNYHELKKFESHFYNEANQEIRIYFPVENALVEHGDKMIEANELGEFEMDSVDGDYAVLGRNQKITSGALTAILLKTASSSLQTKCIRTGNLGTLTSTFLAIRTCTIMTMIWENAVKKYGVKAKGALRIMPGKIAATSSGLRRRGARLGVILVWTITGLAQTAIRRTGPSTSSAVIALLRLLRGIVIKCWQRPLVAIREVEALGFAGCFAGCVTELYVCQISYAL